MKNLRAPLFALPILCGIPLSALAQEVPDMVSLIQLIAAPEKYEGKLVALTGYVHLEFEGNGIYLHKDDYQYAMNKNGLWLDLYECNSRGGKKFTDGYAYVIGRFTSSSQGHLGMWSGELNEIKSCQSWPPLPPPPPGT
ncbi:hypothetical protein K7B09_12645 [Thermomonas sp. RSS23]|uniref:Uncharacterized protein n=1 Tax=Thermomonas beijingensis TaxID=2872701 RepID=A0ABS7THE8_9GAMM|nr:hypothetical protein [Thermomonas beijingensis]MBZ4187170.1 hypothetical protein [Thermomonas beijingensis]